MAPLTGLSGMLFLHPPVSCDINQCDRSDNVETVISLMMNLTDPTFAFKDTLGNELKIKYHVPAQYPLLPSTIEVENKALSMDEAR